MLVADSRRYGETQPPPLSMKAILEFSIPEDDDALTDARQGSDWKFAMGDLLNHLRGRIKHGDNTADELRIFESIQSEVVEILRDRGLSLR